MIFNGVCCELRVYGDQPEHLVGVPFDRLVISTLYVFPLRNEVSQLLLESGQALVLDVLIVLWRCTEGPLLLFFSGQVDIFMPLREFVPIPYSA